MGTIKHSSNLAKNLVYFLSYIYADLDILKLLTNVNVPPIFPTDREMASGMLIIFQRWPVDHTFIFFHSFESNYCLLFIDWPEETLHIEGQNKFSQIANYQSAAQSKSF